MRELSLHIIDIVENSVAAGASNIQIEVEENLIKDYLRINVQDNGMGMNLEVLNQVTDPFYTSRTTRRVGLGIPLLKAAAESCNGQFDIQSTPGLGTLVNIIFQHSHIDRMPLGDLPSTFLNLLVGHPQIHWLFKYQYNENVFICDDKQIKDILGDISLTEPTVLAFLRKYLCDGIVGIQNN